MDPFDGVLRDPVTLHRFLYAGVNPVNNIDPSGNFFLIELMTVQAIMSSLYTANALRLKATFDRSMHTIGRALQPGAQMQSIGMTLMANGIPTGYELYVRGRQLSATGFEELMKGLAQSQIDFGKTLMKMPAEFVTFRSQVLQNIVNFGGEVEKAVNRIGHWAEMLPLDKQKPSTVTIQTGIQRAKQAVAAVRSIPMSAADVTDKFLDWLFMKNP
jgi:hypothetical protein